MALEYIGETGSPSGSTLTITSIPDTYLNLYITGIMHCTGTTEGTAYMRFNNVTTSTYSWMAGGCNTSGTIGTQNQSAGNEAQFAICNPDADYNVGTAVAPVEIEIFSYRGDQPGNAGWLSNNTFAGWNTSTGGPCMLVGGYYTEDEDVDISEIDFYTSQGAWGAHTKFYLYGRTES